MQPSFYLHVFSISSGANAAAVVDCNSSDLVTLILFFAAPLVGFSKVPLFAMLFFFFFLSP